MNGLYKHQAEAVKKLKSGSILCGGVGTGKSRTALAYFVNVECGGWTSLDEKNNTLVKPKPLYIITTARKRDTFEWDVEAAAFGLGVLSDATLFVVDSWNNIGKYTDVTDAFFIFDEQRLVGKGAWAKAFKKIAKRNHWIVLTATPGDVWMDYATIFVANGFYKNQTEFERRHVIYSRFAKFPKVDRYVDTRRLERLRDSILVRMEYQKEAVRHYEWVKIGYDKDHYDRIHVDRWNPYDGEPIKNASELCYLSRKAVNEDPRRIDTVVHIIEKHNRVILFYNFDYELELLRDRLNECHIPYSEWNGHRHQPIVDGNRWVYLVQYTAGAEGWNCVLTNVVIFYSLNYSYKVFEQASGRIDRINTPFPDLYYFVLFSDAPIDRAIRECMKRKRTFNERAFVCSREKQPL